MAGVKERAGSGLCHGVGMHGFGWRCIGAGLAALMRNRWLTVRTCTGRGWGARAAIGDECFMVWRWWAWNMAVGPRLTAVWH